MVTTWMIWYIYKNNYLVFSLKKHTELSLQPDGLYIYIDSDQINVYTEIDKIAK